MRERELFLAALDITDPAARQAHLKVECGGNADLLARVESLLASHEGQSQFLNTPVVEQIADVSESVASATIAYENGSTHDDDPDATTAYSHGTAPMTKQQDDAEFETALGYLEPSSKPGSLGRLGHYEVLEVIGRGAFGTVLRAFDEKLHRVVAIKVMAPEMAATSPARKRFIREAQASAAIRHEHVVSVYAVEEKPLPYLVMEFIPGETLQHRLDAKGPLDVPTVLHLGRQIAEGLAAAHAQDLIHRDIKPANILLETGAREMVKVTDFGLARAADDASLTQSGTIAGTPMYMAPEQAQGQKLDQRADLFSFGSVLYQMVSGRPPFRAATSLAVLKRLAEDTPRPIREIIPETPQWLCDIITKLHAKNPVERYQSAREIADVLANCEDQFKAHAGLKDLSLIPQEKTQPTSLWKWIATAVIVLPFVAFGLSDFNRPEAQPNVARKEITETVTPNPIKPGSVSAPDEVMQPITPKPLPPTFTNSIGMEFVIVPKGKSWLGGGKDKLGDREEAIPADFYLGKYEVTQEEWTQVMGANPSHFSRTGEGQEAVMEISDADLKRLPVEMVSWDECQLFVAKLNQVANATGWVYRLPTATEWEYACRGGPMTDKANSGFDFYFAKPTNNPLREQSSFGKNMGLNRTGKVGSHEANGLGLFDMHRNVWEWCDDRKETADGNINRVQMGGGWNHIRWRSAAGNIESELPSHRSNALGLRLARVPSGAPPAIAVPSAP